MSKSTELVTFKAISLFLRILFINTNISTRTIQFSKFKKWQLKFIKILLLLSKRLIFLYSFSMLFVFDLHASDDFEYAMQSIQKYGWTFIVLLIYATTQQKSCSVLKLLKLIQTNTVIPQKLLSSHFLILFIAYCASYTFQGTGFLLYFMFIPNPFVTVYEFSVFVIGYVLAIFHISMICTFESLIYQQYHAYNQWLRIKIKERKRVSLKMNVIMSLCKQCRLLNRSFGGYVLWKLCYTYVSTILAVYYTLYVPGTIVITSVWFSSVMSELLLIVYFHERR